MGRLEYSGIEESEFVPLSDLVLEDSEEVLEIKSLFQKEEEYLMFLGPIESFIAFYYCDNPKLRDVIVVRALRKVKANFEKGLDFFEKGFERELVGIVMFTLQNAPRNITRHELVLVLRYILWAIDNRKHLGDPRGYLNWICDFFGLLEDEESKRLHDFYDEYGKKFGLDEKMVAAMKGLGGDLSAEETEGGLGDSEEFDEDEDGLWEEGVFVRGLEMEDLSPEERKSFCMGHDEEMDYECENCGVKIGLHCKDWHEGFCDKCWEKFMHS